MIIGRGGPRRCPTNGAVGPAPQAQVSDKTRAAHDAESLGDGQLPVDPQVPLHKPGKYEENELITPFLLRNTGHFNLKTEVSIPVPGYR